MIEITRFLAKQIRTVFKKALALSPNVLAPNLSVRTGPFGLVIQAQNNESAVQYHQPGQRDEAELTIPLAVLDDVQGAKNDPVTLSVPKRGALAAAWEDRGVTRRVEYDLPKTCDKPFPEPPASMTVNPPGLVAALRDACETSEARDSRYALGCIQLRGETGQIAATDGHQLLVQSGFTLGFTDELLAQSTTVFGCRELPQGQPVQIGKTTRHIVVRIGSWTFFLKLGDGRFPRIDDIIPSTINTKTTLELALADAEFFVENLNRLPGSDDHHAVTLDLNGNIAVRAKTIDSPQPTELVLTNSTKTGENLRISIDRKFLERAAAMKFGRIHLFSADEPVLARDDSRTYLWMPLDKEGIIPASNDCLQINSPYGARPKYHTPTTYTRTTEPMNNRFSSPTPATPTQQAEQNSQQATHPIQRRRHRTNGQPGNSVERAIILRDQLRGTLTATKDLIRSLKTERRSQKNLKLALDSLKQLQKVA